jgi:predicted Zn-dependent protease
VRKLIVIGLWAVVAFGQSAIRNPHSAILAAMKAELARARTSLAKQDPAPYFFGYTVTDVDAAQISASNGALESVNRNRARWLDVSVRVGSYDLDNTHQVPGESGLPPFLLPRRGPYDDGDAVLRRALWRATDRAYKDAARQYLRVMTAKDVRVAAEDTSHDFARTGTQEGEEPPATLGADLERRMARWKDSLRTWSEAFRREAHILNSHVTLTARAETNYEVTSDGVTVATSTVLYRLGLLAEAKADDGMDLNRFESFEWRSDGREPESAQVLEKIARMSADLKALRQAPVLEPYSGPAILSGRAAAVFFHEALGHRLEGQRQRERNEGQTFSRKVGERILPSFLSVHDDPTLGDFKSVPLMGHYSYDDEGIAAERVTAVEGGVLRNFLLSRTPVRGFTRSNGHGRGEPGQTPVARQGSLIVSSSRTVPREELRRQLILQVRRLGKPYGLLFGDVEGGYTQTHRFQAQVFQVFPLMVWRIFPDGRPDELVRGAELVGTPLVTLGKIEAAGDDPQVFNGYCGAESGYIPVSAVAPSLLISEMEVQKKARSGDRPPILPPPNPQSAIRNPQSDPVMDAMSDELARTSKELRLGDLERPYYVELRLADLHRVEIGATLGAVTESSDSIYRPATVGVRIGDPSLDNSNFVPSAEPGAGNGAAEMFTVAADSLYAPLRQDLWLGTDQAYKRALSALAAKRALLKTSDREDALPDFAAAAPQQEMTPRREPPGAAGCEEMAKRLSGRFAGRPGLLDSTVRFSFTAANEYFANTAGTRLRRPEAAWTWRASATATADGIRLRAGFSDSGTQLGANPCSPETERALEPRVDSAVRDLLAATAAPRGEEYIGPVLVEAPAAAEIFAALLPPAVTGRRSPLSDNPMTGEMAERETPAINSRILPPSFEVADAPGYSLDDEGVAAQTVKVIEKGVLRRTLASRTPARGGLESNGHGRATPGGPAAAAPSRLTVEPSTTLSPAELKDRLRALCRERGQPYGLLLRRFQAVASAEELSPDDLADPGSEGLLGAMMRGGSPLQPLAVWKVYTADGREELVRGLRLADLRLAALKTIAAAGSDRATTASFYTPAPQFSLAFTAAADGVPFTVTAPSVLFDELELRPQRRSSERGPAYPAPK